MHHEGKMSEIGPYIIIKDKSSEKRVGSSEKKAKGSEKSCNFANKKCCLCENMF